MKNAVSQNIREPRWWNVLPFLSVFIFLSIWQIVALCNPEMFPTPFHTAASLVKMLIPSSGASILIHVWASLQRVLIAYIIACIIGIFLGILFGWSHTIYDYVYPVFELLRPIPPMAWVPLIIIWFGVGETAKIVICFIGCLVPLVVNTLFGVSSLDPTYLKAARVLGAGPRALLFEIVLPGIFPNILAGMKVALSAGWVCVIASEMIAARKGLGYLIIRSMETGNMLNILIALIFIGSISALLSALFSRAEKVVCPW
ncbi:MAG: ABC transporter permease [Clostridiales bacterium]|nr:ABC transporter permease [Clostridiales bacterium]